MQHVESSIKVYFTQDYARFKMINGNRQLNESKIKKIQRDIRDGLDVLRYCPILVVENGNRLDIIDGQHRFYVARTIKTKVWYIICENMEITEIAKINSNTEKWKNADFINAYVQKGNKNYQILQEFMDKYPIPLSVATKLLRSGRIMSDSGDGSPFGFQRGEFQAKAKKEAYAFMELAERFNASNCWSKRGFLVALDKVKEAGICDLEELIEKVTAHPEKMIESGSYKEFLQSMEEVYNIRDRKSVV